METSERYARLLASGHQFVQSVATENVCGECGAHKEFHALLGTQKCQGCGITHASADCPNRLRRPCPSSPVPCWSLVNSGFAPDNVRAYQLQGQF